MKAERNNGQPINLDEYQERDLKHWQQKIVGLEKKHDRQNHAARPLMTINI